MTLKVASVSETVTVTGESPLIETSSSSVGGVVDIRRIESLPLNGRQFANLAATIPGVGLGFHSDPTKSTQYAPQINGGAGRNVNYQIDGGDNNDDTVGGLLQAYPLEAIQEFNFVTQRFKAEYGRSNGGVMNIVTKSGTNNLSRKLLRVVPRQVDERADRDREDLRTSDKQDYRRNQFGGSFGGPIAEGQGALLRRRRADAAGHDADREHEGAVPDAGRRLHRAVPREPVDRQGHGEPERRPVPVGPLRLQQQHAAVRRRRPTTPRQLGRQHEQVQLDQPESQLGAAAAAKLNEFIFQYADFGNNIASRSSAPNETFPNGVTDRRQRQHAADDASSRSTSSATTSRGTSRAWAASATTSRPASTSSTSRRLFITFNTGKGAIFNTHLDQRRERSDLDGDGERRRFVGQHPDEAVRHLRPGRLAGERSR